MMFFPALVCFLLMWTADAGIGNSIESSCCTETNECLLYDLVCQIEDFEVRHYDSVKWISTGEEIYSMERAKIKALQRLTKYMTGKNERGYKMDMTTPVVTRVTEGHFSHPSRMQMSFVLPAEHQKDPPKPTDDTVYFEETPDMNVYVQSYKGFATDSNDKITTKALAKRLDSMDAKYSKPHYIVRYNSPVTLSKRHNEIWLVAKGNPVCPSNFTSKGSD